MKVITSRSLKASLMAVAALTVIALGQSAARADEVHIAGYTNGCFCLPPPAPNTSATQVAALFPGLTFVNSTFAGTTADGFLGLGGNPQAAPTQNLNNLGSIQLSTAQATYTGFNFFTLRVTFTAPEGIADGNSRLLSATVTGAVSSTGTGGVFIDFDNTPILFTFSDNFCQGQPATTCGNGAFFFSVNDLGISPGQLASVNGQITAAQQTAIPEPATLLLLGTGLTGVAAGVRRRRRQLPDKKLIM